VRHFLKDIRIALDEAKKMGLATPGLALAEELYETVVALGGKNLGTQALYRALENMSV
jgi:3-hydroxyisobutyrate dehydrogenase